MAEESYSQKLAKLLYRTDPERDRKYYEALGRFVTSYARAEIQVHVLTRHYSTAKDAQARILLHRLGLKKVADLLRDLMESRKFEDGILGAFVHSPVINEIAACLNQLALISGKRGDLVHRDSLTSDAGFELNNTNTAKSLTAFEQSVISLDELKAMTWDCGMIFLRLHRIEHPETKYPPLPDGLPSWQYKPPRLTPPKTKKMKARKARKLQRGALCEKR